MIANQKRLFADVVTVDAWHSPFRSGVAMAELRVDAVFDVGRLGGEPEAPVRFRLGLRQAEVVVIIPPTEPVEVVRASVARDNSLRTMPTATIDSLSKGATTGAGIQIQSPLLEAASEAMPLMPNIAVSQSQDAEGHYRWRLRPQQGQILIGRGWDAAASPRLTLRDKRKSLAHVGASVRIEVRCLREDLDIIDIQLKDTELDEAIRSTQGYGNRRAAAESYIRSALSREQLYFSNFEDPFGELCVADVAAQEGE